MRCSVIAIAIVIFLARCTRAQEPAPAEHLSAAVNAGLEYLVKQQTSDGDQLGPGASSAYVSPPSTAIVSPTT